MTFLNAIEDLKEFLGENIIGGLEVTDAGGLDITWVEGMIYDAANDLNSAIVAGSGSVTDDDTTFLLWASGTGLILRGSTATGNEVLIATIIASSGNIDSITEEGFDFDSVSGITARPIIRLGGDKIPSLSRTSGEIILSEENLLGSEASWAYRKDSWRIIIKLSKTNLESGSKIIKNIANQIDALFIASNKLMNNTKYALRPSWDTKYRAGFIRLVVDIDNRVAL